VAEIPYRLQTGSSFEQIIPLINDAFNSIDAENRTKIIKNGVTPTILFGYQKAGFGTFDYGLKIAKPTFDVTTATNDQLIFNSGLDHLKVVSTGTLVVTIPPGAANGSTYTATYPHGLGYIPAFVAYAFFNSAYYNLPLNSYSWNGTSFVTGAFASATVDATNLVVTVGVNGFMAGTTMPIKYYILQETAN